MQLDPNQDIIEYLLLNFSNMRWSILAEALKSLKHPPYSVVEVGVYDGTCSRLLRKLLPSAKLYLIDPWEVDTIYQESNGPRTIEESTINEAFKKVQNFFQDDPLAHILKKTSKEASSLVPNGLDLVFIDGNHDYEFVKEDIELWLPKLRPGGILAGHDYERFSGVKSAVHELLGNDISIKKDDVWLYYKK
jgi:hypothetical protein